VYKYTKIKINKNKSKPHKNGLRCKEMDWPFLDSKNGVRHSKS
jgi:hypothetical protein